MKYVVRSAGPSSPRASIRLNTFIVGEIMSQESNKMKDYRPFKDALFDTRTRAVHVGFS